MLRDSLLGGDDCINKWSESEYKNLKCRGQCWSCSLAPKETSQISILILKFKAREAHLEERECAYFPALTQDSCHLKAQ